MNTATPILQSIDFTSLRFLAGYALSVFLILFFVIAFFWGKNLSQNQFAILKILSALCAAIAAGVISGELSLHKEGAMNITASSGFALFVIVWFVFPKYKISLEDGFSINIPAGKTFKEIINIIVEQDNAFVEFNGFDDNELNAVLKSRQLQTKTIQNAMENLRLITINSNAIGKYAVTKNGSTYVLNKH